MARTGTVLWRGKSKITKKDDIVVIATVKSSNKKTGDAIQIWILDEHINPIEGKKTQQDKSICGNCSVKDNCYVNVYYAPHAVWKSYKKGNYDEGDALLFDEKNKNKLIRFGAYGDPINIPVDIIKKLSENRKYKGYTHQWKKLDKMLSADEIEFMKTVFQASVESIEDKELANSQGWSTFRIRDNEEVPLEKGEIVCPAEKTNLLVTCDKCINCCGCSSKNVTIIDHGPKTRRKKRKELSV